MKRIFYILCFAILGLILATLAHAGTEHLLLQLIFGNPEQFADTIWWQEWPLFHRIGGAALWLAGLVGGIYLGFKYWRIIYVEGKRKGIKSTSSM